MPEPMSTCQAQTCREWSWGRAGTRTLQTLNSGSLPDQDYRDKVGASPVRLVYCSPSRFDDSIHRVFSPQTGAACFAPWLLGRWPPRPLISFSARTRRLLQSSTSHLSPRPGSRTRKEPGACRAAACTARSSFFFLADSKSASSCDTLSCQHDGMLDLT